MKDYLSKKAAVLVALLAATTSMVLAADKKADRVQGLPNVVSPLPSKWYSGYLNVTDTKLLHYIFVESLNNPTTDPVLLWFNGGPGCSSMEGLFAELGPFIFDDGETFIKPNPFPWNMNASVLYIESPAGVGFSVANTSADFVHSDVSQSDDLFTGLRNFFNAFPDFRSNDIYITGESYAGVYVPYLAWQIHEWNLVQEMNKLNDTYNLKGFIVGNGVTDNYIDTDNQMIESIAAWSMIPLKLQKQIVDNGCIFYWDSIDLHAINPPICQTLYDNATGLIADFNIYDLYRTQYAGSNGGLRMKAGESRHARHFRHEKFLKLKNLKDGMEGYLNRADVRESLNIPNYVQAYSGCSDRVGENYLGLREASIWIYNILLGYPRYKLMHYSGNTDAAVATLGTRRWIKEQSWAITNEWRPWTTNGDLSGYLEDRGNFTFATIHGVGHMAPQWKRQAVTQLITRFAHNLPLDQE